MNSCIYLHHNLHKLGDRLADVCSANLVRARKELSNLSRYTSARRKLCCLRRVVNCFVLHTATTAANGDQNPGDDEASASMY